MKGRDLHVSDQELLMTADGELSASRMAQIRAHLAACWECRTRIAEIERTIGDFVKLHHQSLDPQLPRIDGARAALKAQLTELIGNSRGEQWWKLPFIRNTRCLAYVCAALLVVLFGTRILYQGIAPRESSARSGAYAGLLPNADLTPGATRPVAISDVCSMVHEEVVRAVPAALRQQVFREYGIGNDRAADYEIDYLIAPGLGGAEDIHNLWPESYTTSAWNAHDKDALEERLHQMVCDGKLDLRMAQREIATDWIASYKKYFHTNQHSISANQYRTKGQSNTNQERTALAEMCVLLVKNSS